MDIYHKNVTYVFFNYFRLLKKISENCNIHAQSNMLHLKSVVF